MFTNKHNVWGPHIVRHSTIPVHQNSTRMLSTLVPHQAEAKSVGGVLLPDSAKQEINQVLPADVTVSWGSFT